jgi:hypothetical protein
MVSAGSTRSFRHPLERLRRRWYWRCAGNWQPKEFSTPASPGRSAPRTGSPLRVSSGVVAPKLIHTVNISSEGDWTWKLIQVDRIAVVGMIVDQNGKPSDLKIIRSINPIMDKNVLAAVSQYRFKPGTVSHQPTAVPLELEIVVRNPAL